MGYCLTGDMREEMFGFAYGPGGAGKGTFFGAAQSILADYGLQMGMDVFSANSKTNQEYARATMVGARMIMASETKVGDTWNEAGLKEYSGNEGLLSARQIFGKIFSFRLQAKILLIGNSAPKLAGEASSMRRRLHVIPFNHVAQQKNDKLKEALRAEYPQILRWILDGCAAWQRDGLGTCDKVQAASAAYFEEQDAVQSWANERLEVGAGCRVKRADLLADYTAWARANGEDALAAHGFYETARRTLNLTDYKTMGVRYLIGAAIRVEGGEFPKAEDSDFTALLH
jgi:putative DNA primase/helicase